MKLKVIDKLTPEDVAMLQALYSRSAESVDVHLDKVAKSGSGKFMSSFYVGYGHKSIADCGSTTMFIEGVSLLAAKAIQDWPLYSGQETSTRYIDMSKQPIVDPVGSPESKAILDRWMAFYNYYMADVADVVIARHPRRDGEDEEKYLKAVKARTFDIMRGFLPAGITTQLSWHSNLRQAGDHLQQLTCHPALEVAQIALGLRGALDEKYPSSGFAAAMAGVSGVSVKEDASARIAWEQMVAEEFTYSARSEISPDSTGIYMKLSGPGFLRYHRMLATRPRGCVLPHILSDRGQFHVEYALDFGSFRDLQRHRNGVVRMPLLGTSYGFEPWYLEQLGDSLRQKACELIWKQQAEIARLPADAVTKQYYTALGYRVPCNVMMALPALVYFMELRSSKTVHPTLRAKTLAMVRWFKQEFPGITLHIDEDPDDWTLRRGEQTITEKR